MIGASRLVPNYLPAFSCETLMAMASPAEENRAAQPQHRPALAHTGRPRTRPERRAQHTAINSTLPQAGAQLFDPSKSGKLEGRLFVAGFSEACLR